MEYKKEIVQNVSNEIKSLFSNDLNNLVSKIINENYDKKSKLLELQKKDYLDTLDVGREIFPNPKETGLFRFCGKCYRCNKNMFNENMTRQSIQEFINECNNNEIKNFAEDYNLKNNEYFIACTIKNIYEMGLYFISNYGLLYHKSIHHNIIYYQGKYKMALEGEDGGGGRPLPVYSEFIDITLPLTQEYIDILNIINLGINNNKMYDHWNFNKIMHVYKQYHPKANEIYIIEQKTNKLLEKENEIKVLEGNYQKKWDELKDLEDQLINKEIKLQEDINVHKEKIKNLFKRENEVKLKETINSCKDELMSSALSLNDVLSIIPWPEDDDYDIIKAKIDNVINIMNKLI